MKTRARIYISGMVQGVFFRSFVRSRASLLNLTGFVRNTNTGEVEAVFEGDRDLVEQIIEECKKGPEGASVEEVKVKWEKPGEEFKGFDIRD